MIEGGSDEFLVNLLWCVKGGEITIGKNGVDVFSLNFNGAEPVLDIKDFDTFRDFTPQFNVNFLERVKELSKNISAKGRNLRVTNHGDLILNLGKGATSLNSIEKLAGLMLRRTRKIIKNRKG